MCHTTHQELAPNAVPGYDNTLQRRTTPAQFYTAAHLAYARGCDGVSTFNFVYYREHGVGDRGPGSEPPFEVFHHLGDSEWLAQQPQHYFLSEGWGRNGCESRPMPRALSPGQTESFVLDVAPPAGGWRKGGRLRIQSNTHLGASQWRAALNAVTLEEDTDRSEPHDNPYPQLLRGPENHRAWIVPADLPKDGMNTIEVSMLAGRSPAKLVFLDLAIE